MKLPSTKNNNNRPIIISAWLSLAVICMTLISGCSSAVKAPTEDVSTSSNENRYYPNSSNTLESEANTQDSLIQLETLIAQNQFNQAELVASSIDGTRLSLQDQSRLSLSKATISSARNDSRQTLNLLSEVQTDLLSQENAAKYYWLKARAAYQAGDQQQALEALASRSDYLNQSQINSNESMMRSLAGNLSLQNREYLKNSTKNRNLQHWLNSTDLNNSNTVIPLNNFEGTSQYTASLNNIAASWTQNSPKRIAVLLPFTSKFASIAADFEKGLNSAHEQNTSPYRPQVTYYDVGPGNIEQQIAIASESGADFIIGPLGNQASNIALNNNTRTPIMAIGGNAQEHRRERYTFSLNPEADAIAIANHARSKGHINAIAFWV